MLKIDILVRICVLLAIRPGSASPMKRNKLIYILLDGFRYDYVDDQPKGYLPGFTKFLEEGVRAEYMTPLFPSVSYPDWTTLVTGLYAESHGIVGNYFYDADDKSIFSLPDSDSTGRKKWWTSEPIWATASKANLKTAVMLWSRCDIPFDGVTPDFCEHFLSVKGKSNFRTNIIKAISKLQEGYDLIMVYNEHADSVGHDSGPETEERKQVIRDLDAGISDLFLRLKHIDMDDEVNVIIVSDHGMATTKAGSVNIVELDQYLLDDLVENIGNAGAFSNIKVKEGYIDEVYNKLREMPGVEVYKHDEIPEELHFKNNTYIHDILLKADINTFIMKSISNKQIPPRKDDKVLKGNHGYDPREEKMRAIFFAHGPDFKQGAIIPAIKNVDVYPLLTHLLQIRPQPNNGTFDNIKMALSMDASDSHTTGGTSSVTGTIVLLILTIVLRMVY